MGVVRIQGELRRLGHRIAASAIRKILRAHRIPPPSGRDGSWAVFLRAHAPRSWPLISSTPAAHSRSPACTWRSSSNSAPGACTCPGLPGTRRASGPPNLPAISPADWKRREPVHLPDPGPDTKFTAAFGAVFASTGITVLPIAPQAPRMNAYAERFVRTVRAECTDRMLIAGEQYLRVVLSGYIGHYNTGRSHQGDSMELRAPDNNLDVIAFPVPATGIQRRARLAGLINEYRQAA